MNELQLQFVTEARELIEQAGEALLVLERHPDDRDAINRLFRAVHTIKGSSGLFDAVALTTMLHAAEDVLHAVREQGLTLVPGIVDLTFQALDQAAGWVDHLDGHDRLPADALRVAQSRAAELRALLGGGIVAQSPAAGGSGEAAEPKASLPDLAGFPDAVLAGLAAEASADSVLLLVVYRPEEGCFFKGEDPLHLALQIPALRGLVVTPRQPLPPLAELDPFACLLDIKVLSTAPRAEIETLFRYVPEQVEIQMVQAAGPCDADPADDGAHLRQAVWQTVLQEQVELLAMAAPAEEVGGRIASAARAAVNALRFAGRPAAAAGVEQVGQAAIAAGDAASLAAAIAAAATGDGDRPSVREPAPEPAERSASRTLRVDQDKVDALMNLVGELVVAKNSLPFLARKAEQQFGVRELAREIKDQYAVIDRIAQELQGAVMSVRMMPVGQVFQRFPRLVRDISRKLGKQVELAIDGEATEADKNVIESLYDPLLHMVRNSLDHGIEDPADRLAQGKPVSATIRLAARQENDQVLIEVADDGRGIDPEAIKRKAGERGLLGPERLAAITDDDARMLIFAAGFSTAETVSDLSGRGVGMDVVRTAVEKAGGRIALSSELGRGTTIRLSVPLSMAVTRVMTVTTGNRLFGIPMDAIVETVKLPRAGIVQIKNRQAFVLRDRVVPLIDLADLLELPDPPAEIDEVGVLVVRVAHQTVGLAITAFGEGMEVILKPLHGVLAGIAGYAGTALLGDGRVLLVLDLKELLP